MGQIISGHHCSRRPGRDDEFASSWVGDAMRARPVIYEEAQVCWRKGSSLKAHAPARRWRNRGQRQSRSDERADRRWYRDAHRTCVEFGRRLPTCQESTKQDTLLIRVVAIRSSASSSDAPYCNDRANSRPAGHSHGFRTSFAAGTGRYVSPARCHGLCRARLPCWGIDGHCVRHR
jgi:hypothetical protein